jgi:hypothetical protein
MSGEAAKRTRESQEIERGREINTHIVELSLPAGGYQSMLVIAIWGIHIPQQRIMAAI